MRIWYQNEIDAETVLITATSEVSTLPVLNLKHDFRKRVFRSNSTPATFYVTLDFIGGPNIDSCFVLDHTIDPSCTVTLEASANSFSTVAFSTVLGYAQPLIGSFANQNYRYWRLKITHASAVPIFQIGRLFLGKGVTLGDEPEYEDYAETNADPSRIQQTLGGQQYVEEVEKYTVLELRWKLARDATYGQLTLLDNWCGKGRSFLIQIDTVVTPLAVYYYVREDNDLKAEAAVYTDAYNPLGELLWNIAMRLREQV